MSTIRSLPVLASRASAWRCLVGVLLLFAAVSGQCQILLLHQLATGELDLFAPSEGVYLPLRNFTCTAASGCASNWRFIGPKLAITPGSWNGTWVYDEVDWFDPGAGTVNAASWTPYSDNGVYVDVANLDMPPVVASWTCTTASSCATQWKIVGTGSFDAAQHPGLLWFNATTGQLGAWVMQKGGAVLNTVTLNATCGPGCSNKWVPVATGDFNGDGHTDVLWFDRSDGLLGIWYLNGAGGVTSTVILSWTCDTSCSSVWNIVGSADFERVGKDDIVWWNTNTGQVGYWKVGPSGAVVGSDLYSTFCVPSGGAWGCKVEAVLAY